jgi:accessory gene regulator B
MIHRIADRLTALFYAQNIINSDQQDVYAYGMELILSGGIGIFNIILISIFFGGILHGLMFLAVLIPVRLYAGGYHANTHLGCNIAFICVYIFSIGIEKICLHYDIMITIFVLTLIAFMVTTYFSPIDNKNKILMPEEKSRYKEVSSLIYGGIILLSLFLYITGHELSLYINILLIIVTLLQLIGLWKGGKVQYEENT